MYYTCTCKCACICTYVYSLDAYLNRLAQPFRWLGSVWGFKQDTSGAICREDVKGTEAGAEQVEGRTRLKAAAVERGQQKGSRVSALDLTRLGPNGGQWAAEGKGELLFENVTFCYPSRPQHVALDSVSLRVPGGLTVAVVGASGCGKSTLFALALRFYAPRSGRITLDGVDLQDVPEATLRRAVAWVPQEPPIFANRTVMENMAYGRSMVAGSAGPGLAELEPAARAANAWEYICKLPQGLNTMLGEGTALSGGQKQRLALARALLCDPCVLLLDEPTSALDAASTRMVEDAVLRSNGRRTVIFTTHAMAQARLADIIVVMDGGQVVEHGSHEELLDRNAVYARLLGTGAPLPAGARKGGPDVRSGDAKEILAPGRGRWKGVDEGDVRGGGSRTVKKVEP